MATDTVQAYEQVMKDIQAKKYAPVYFLHGEESFFIDSIAEALENQVLNESEKSFNQSIFYGKDIDSSQVMAAARRFPMMSAYQLIIIKEAQDLKGLDVLIPYFQQPLSSTVLVFCYKNKKLDKRTKLASALKNTVLFESNKLYESQVPAWIKSYLGKKNLKINEKACLLLSDYIGADLTRIANELDKLLINKKDLNNEISMEEIESNVGISKEFNIFELQNAIGSGNSYKVFYISHHITQSKDFSIIPLISNLYSFFSKLYVAHSLPDKSKNGLMKSLGINFYFADDYLAAMRNYPLPRLERVFRVLKTFDLKSKGIGDAGTPEKQLLREFLGLILVTDKQ